MGDPTIVYRIIAWELHGPYLFTALLKVIKLLVDHLTANLAPCLEVLDSGCVMDVHEYCFVK